MSLYKIIQCPTDIHNRKAGIYGTTWVIWRDALSPNHVYVLHSVCSPEDQFSRKKGYATASSKAPKHVHKADLPKYVQNVGNKKNVYFLPSVEQIYQAVIRL